MSLFNAKTLEGTGGGGLGRMCEAMLCGPRVLLAMSFIETIGKKLSRKLPVIDSVAFVGTSLVV